MPSIDDLLREAEQQSAKIGDATLQPQLQKSVHELSSRMDVSNFQSGGDANRHQKANMLFSNHGINLDKLSSQINDVSSAKPTPSVHATPNTPNDVESLIQNHLDNMMAQLVDETNDRVFTAVQDSVEAGLTTKWENEKKWIIDNFSAEATKLGQQGSLIEKSFLNSSVLTQSTYSDDVTSVLIDCTMAYLENKPSRSALDLAQSIENSLPVSCSHVSLFWSLLVHLCANNASSDISLLRERFSPKSTLFSTVRSWLHRQHLNRIQETVQSRMLESKAGTTSGIAPMVACYVDVMSPSFSMPGQPKSAWVHAFHCLTVGDYTTAAKLLKEEGHDVVAETLIGQVRHDAIVRLWNEFQCTVKHSVDQYQKVIYCLILGFPIYEDPGVKSILSQDMLTFLWFSVTQILLVSATHENTQRPVLDMMATVQQKSGAGAGLMASPASLYSLQKLVSSSDFIARHQFQGPKFGRGDVADLQHALALFCVGLFEAGLEMLFKSNAAHCVHIAICLYEAGQLFVPDIADTLLFNRKQADHEQVLRLNMARLLTLFTKGLQKERAPVALSYMTLVSTVKTSTGESFFEAYLTKTLLNCKNPAVLCALVGSRPDDNPTKLESGVLQRLVPKWQEVLRGVAHSMQLADEIFSWW